MAGLLAPRPTSERMMPERAPAAGRGDEMPPDAAPGMMSPTEGGDDEEAANVSADEQTQYNRFVTNGMNLIFNEEKGPAILSRITASPNPVEGLASSAVMLVDALRDSAARKGIEISPEVMLHGGIELMENIAELAEAAKIHAYTPEELEQALYVALDQWGTQEVQRGGVNKEALQQEVSALLEADRSGRLEEILPGITAKADEIRGRGAEAAPNG